MGSGASKTGTSPESIDRVAASKTYSASTGNPDVQAELVVPNELIPSVDPRDLRLKELEEDLEVLQKRIVELETQVPQFDYESAFIGLKHSVDASLQELVILEQDGFEAQKKDRADDDSGRAEEEDSLVENYEKVDFPAVPEQSNESHQAQDLSLENISEPSPRIQDSQIAGETDVFARNQSSEILDKLRGLLGEGQRLREVFDSIDTDGSGFLDEDEMRKAIADLGVETSKEHIAALMKYLDKDSNGRIDFREFRKAVHHIPSCMSEVDLFHQWLITIDVAGVIAKAILSGIEGDCFKTLLSSSSEDIRNRCASCIEKLSAHVYRSLDSLKKSQPSEDKADDHRKFALAGGSTTGFYGARSDFFQPLGDRIGLPMRDALDGMLAEHKTSSDSEVEFYSPRIDAMTQPSKEWDFVIAPEVDADYQSRQIVSIDSLLQHEHAVEGELTKAELVALRLFSGPMYAKYNARLREDRDERSGGKADGYVTTIHCIVSGIRKLSRLYKEEDFGTVFCGLSGSSLPLDMLESNERNWKGIVDLGFVSATSRIELALQNWRARGQNVPPTILSITFGTMDLGAPLKWLSQIPEEEEIVFPPNSNLELNGASRVEWVGGMGPVIVKPLRLSVSPRASTLIEMENFRKRVHLDCVQNARNLAHLSLRNAIQTGSATHQPRVGSSKPPVSITAGAGERRLQESSGTGGGGLEHLKEWLGDLYDLERVAGARSGRWYEDEGNWMEAQREVSQTKLGCIKRFQLFHRLKRQGWGGAGEALARGPAALLCTRLLPARRFANPGYEQRVRSGFADVDFEGLAGGSVTVIPRLISVQTALLAWECLESRLSGDPQAKVVLRGRGGLPVEVGVKYLSGELRVLKGFRGDDLELNKPWFGLDIAPIAGPAMLTNPLLLSARVETRPIPVLKLIRAVRVDLTGYFFSQSEALVLVEVLRRCMVLTSLYMDENLGGEAEAELARVIACQGQGQGLDLLTQLNNLNLAQLGGIDGSTEPPPLRAYEAAFLARRLAIDESITKFASLSLEEIKPAEGNVVSERLGWDVSGKLAALEPCLATSFVCSRVRWSGHVTSLNLSGNSLRHNGAALLSQHLPNLASVERLVVANNDLGGEGCAVIASAGAAMQSLVHLDLGGNAGGDEGCVATCSAASLMPHLTSLSFANNNAGPLAARAVAYLLKMSSSLRSLSLIGNGIAEEGWSSDFIRSYQRDCAVEMEAEQRSSP